MNALPLAHRSENNERFFLMFKARCALLRVVGAGLLDLAVGISVAARRNKAAWAIAQAAYSVGLYCS